MGKSSTSEYVGPGCRRFSVMRQALMSKLDLRGLCLISSRRRRAHLSTGSADAAT